MGGLLDLWLFSQQVYDLELVWYKQQMNEYGMPQDNRGETTKTDWQMWTTRLFDDPQYTDLIVDAMWRYLCQTLDRVPVSDCNFTTQPYTRIFIARTV